MKGDRHYHYHLKNLHPAKIAWIGIASEFDLDVSLNQARPVMM